MKNNITTFFKYLQFKCKNLEELFNTNSSPDELIFVIHEINKFTQEFLNSNQGNYSSVIPNPYIVSKPYMPQPMEPRPYRPPVEPYTMGNIVSPSLETKKSTQSLEVTSTIPPSSVEENQVNKNDINFEEYIPLYRTYYNCDSDDMVYLYLNFQFVMLKLKKLFVKDNRKYYMPGAFLYKLVTRYRYPLDKEENSLFQFAHSRFSAFLKTNKFQLITFFNITNTLLLQNKDIMDDGVTYSSLRRLLSDTKTRDINLYLEYREPLKDKADNSSDYIKTKRELSAEEKKEVVLLANKKKVNQLLSRLYMIILEFNSINSQYILVEYTHIVHNDEFKELISPFLKDLNSFIQHLQHITPNVLKNITIIFFEKKLQILENEYETLLKELEHYSVNERNDMRILLEKTKIKKMEEIIQQKYLTALPEKFKKFYLSLTYFNKEFKSQQEHGKQMEFIKTKKQEKQKAGILTIKEKIDAYKKNKEMEKTINNLNKKNDN